MRRIILLALAISATSAQAQFKCTGADGSVSFQQTPCTTSQASERLRLPVAPVLDQGRPEYIRRAISDRKIVLGMTRAELDRVMVVQPDTVNSSVYSSGRKDQLIYRQDGRTLYVYTDNGMVSAVQDTSGPRTVAVAEQPTYTRQERTCPSDAEIRDIEFRQSKISNRGNDQLQAELARQLGQARACRRGE